MIIKNVTAVSMAKCKLYRQQEEERKALAQRRADIKSGKIKLPIKIVERKNGVRTVRTIERPQ